jgi:hypothetical protein
MALPPVPVLVAADGVFVNHEGHYLSKIPQKSSITGLAAASGSDVPQAGSSQIPVFIL